MATFLLSMMHDEKVDVLSLSCRGLARAVIKGAEEQVHKPTETKRLVVEPTVISSACGRIPTPL
eukprot:1008317-Prymnesium_polylepis.1